MNELLHPREDHEEGGVDHFTQVVAPEERLSTLLPFKMAAWLGKRPVMQVYPRKALKCIVPSTKQNVGFC